MAEPGSQESVPQSKAPQQNPTEASKGLLSRIVHGAKETGINVGLNMVPGGAYASAVRREGLKREATMPTSELTAMPDVQPKPKFIPERLSQQDPTEASKGFLRKFTDRLFTDRPEAAQVFLQSIAASRATQLAVQDFMQGNYPSAVAEGIIAGVLAVSPIRMINSIRRPL